MDAGRKPKSAALRLLEGNPGHRPIKQGVIVPKVDNLPDAPNWLDEMGKKEWNEKGKILFGLGILSNIDLSLFAGLCDLYSNYRHSAERVDRMSYFKEYRICCELFGMTPSSRMKLNVKAPAGKRSRIEELIDG